MLDNLVQEANIGLGQKLHSARALEDDLDYSRFDNYMKKAGYDWEVKKVTTEDSYILSTFHILGKSGQTRPNSFKATILTQHGSGMDGADFFDGKKSFLLKLVDEGYDMWIGNNRGTEWS